VVGIFGPSGAGKSTLFRALAGDLPIARGQVRIFGEIADGFPLWRRARKGLGYLPQTPSVLADLSVDENLATFAKLAPSFSRARADEFAKALGLAEKLGVVASQLSGGERRKLEIVRALGAKPRALICDEPFAALDPKAKEIAGELFRKAADDGAAVLLADHDVKGALALCDRAVLLLAGRIACEAKPEAFVKEAVVVAHYVALS
jgi:lipopolysaccharide export system ATP-binding protein